MIVTQSTVYALDMPKYLYVQLHTQQGAPPAQPIRIRADKFEKQDANKTIIKLGDTTVGEFATHAIAGWWIQDEEV